MTVPHDRDPSNINYCRTCRTALEVFYGTGHLQYRHTRPGHDDHMPVPTPVTELDHVEMVCDFCSGPDVTWCYVLSDIEKKQGIVKRVTADLADYRDQHYAARVRKVQTEGTFTRHMGERWTACNDCSEAIEADDVMALVRHVTSTLATKHTRANRIAETRAKLVVAYTEMFSLSRTRVAVTKDNPLGLPGRRRDDVWLGPPMEPDMTWLGDDDAPSS